MVEEFCRVKMIALAENNPLSFATFRRGTFSKIWGRSQGYRRKRGMVLNGEEEASFTFHTTGERRLGKSVCQRRWQ